MNIQELLRRYSEHHPRRASGGIWAMAGFAYQAEVAISRSVASLTATGDFSDACAVFVEALSDIAEQTQANAWALLQVKRTLTGATLDSAAAEIAAIEAVDAVQATPLRPEYGVVCQYHEIGLDWDKLPRTSAHTALIQTLLQQGRLHAPQCQPNPRKEALAALWRKHRDPFGFFRYAVDRVLRRKAASGDAEACWEDIAERYREGTAGSAAIGLWLQASDVDVQTDRPILHLDVGQRVTWARWRSGQYMERPTRAQAAVTQALAMLDDAQRTQRAELAVHWLTGRSGAGKSVLLLNVVSELVTRGLSVLWLKPEEVAPALKRIVDEKDAEGAMPDFLAVDDIFDPDARDHLDLTGVSNLVDEQGERTWPVLLTCGPSEFADDFEEQSRYQGFRMHFDEVSLLDRAETEQFVQWVSNQGVRSSEQDEAALWVGQAMSQSEQGQGLFVSVATEMAQGDMRHFGQKLATRLKSHGEAFAQHLRLCLAVNRLYLRAPATWLNDDDRAQLEDINRDGDFVLEATERDQEWLRLTHPHLSNAIYPHLLAANRPRLYAQDLGDAFARALDSGHGLLAQRLLQAFSRGARQERDERMAVVDGKFLAQRCVEVWRRHPPGGDARIQAGMRVSLACWPDAYAYLGQSKDDLIADALSAIDEAEAQYPRIGLVGGLVAAFVGCTSWPQGGSDLGDCEADAQCNPSTNTVVAHLGRVLLPGPRKFGTSHLG